MKKKNTLKGPKPKETSFLAFFLLDFHNGNSLKHSKSAHNCSRYKINNNKFIVRWYVRSKWEIRIHPSFKNLG